MTSGCGHLLEGGLGSGGRSIRAWVLPVSLVCVVLLAAGCASSGSTAPAPGPSVGVGVPAVPTVVGPLPVTATSYPFLASDHDSTPINLTQSGYLEQEYLVSGRAHVYAWPDLDTLRVVGSGPYTTRILIRRPADPARFSGIVRVEPLNPTSGHDLDAEWEIAHAGFMHNGDAYVGVTVTPATMTALRRFDPSRYGRLEMLSPLPPAQRCPLSHGSPDTSGETGLAWDILSQVGGLIKTDNPANPLRDLQPRESVLTGWSQSGSYDLTYLNAIARHVTLGGGKPVFDGYLPGAGSYAGTPISQCAPWPPTGDPRARYNPPTGIPVIVVSTPTDFYTAASFPRRTDRPADSDTPARRIRLYEIAGGCHLPGDQGTFFPDAAETRRAGFPPENRIAYPLSAFPLHVVLDAAFANLDNWITHHVAPPRAPRLRAVNPSAWPVQATTDPYGNPLGGVRTPAVDVPTATYLPRGLKAPHSDNSTYAGHDVAFSPEYLTVLYPTHSDYLDKVTADVHTLHAARWLTAYDADQTITQAQSAHVPGP